MFNSQKKSYASECLSDKRGCVKSKGSLMATLIGPILNKENPTLDQIPEKRENVL
jgi:hypothetical protein